ncbi:MFS transporter [Actinoallomurus sp. CA-150999]|uniref:MFS transporter n=1 Tax=Actinoallomurus sp. CA-150999 TaxID=3239887 RepID=UPI003D8CA34E
MTTPAKLDRGTLVACCLAVAIAQMCITIPAPINGAITSAFGASGSQVAWVTSAFILPTAILELNFGVVGDMFGRKRLLVLGGLVLAVGELLNATAQNIHWLWIGQAVAGMGAAALFPSSLAVIAAATPESQARAKALSTWALSISIASALGPLLSGGIAESGDFRWAFAPPAVIGLVAAVVCWRFVTDSKAPDGRSLDWPGQISVAVALFAVLWAVIQGSSMGWGNGAVVAAFVIAGVFLIAFVVAELRSAAPMMNLALLRIPAFAGAAGVALVGMLGFIGTAYCVSIRLGAVMHLSPLRAGLPFVILQAIPLLLAPVLSRLLGQTNPRWLLLAGLLPMAAGQFWLSAIPITTTSLPAFIGPVLLLGVGFIFVVSSLTAAAVNAVPIHLTGMASGATSLVREFGQALGPAVISAVAMGVASSALAGKLSGAGAAVNHAGGPLAVVNVPAVGATAHAAARSALAHGLSVGMVVCGIASLVGAVITVVVVRPDSSGRTVDATATDPLPA